MYNNSSLAKPKIAIAPVFTCETRAKSSRKEIQSQTTYGNTYKTFRV